MLRFILSNARILITLFNAHVNKGKDIYIRNVNNNVIGEVNKWGETEKLKKVYSAKRNL